MRRPCLADVAVELACDKAHPTAGRTRQQTTREASHAMHVGSYQIPKPRRHIPLVHHHSLQSRRDFFRHRHSALSWLAVVSGIALGTPSAHTPPAPFRELALSRPSTQALRKQFIDTALNEAVQASCCWAALLYPGEHIFGIMWFVALPGVAIKVTLASSTAP